MANRVKLAISEAWIQQRVMNAQKAGVSDKRMSDFISRRSDATDRNFNRAFTDAAQGKPLAPVPGQINPLQMAEKNQAAASHGLHAMMSRPPTPPAHAPAQGLGRFLPKSNWGRAGLAVGVAAAGSGAYRALRPQPQQPQPQQAQAPRPVQGVYR